MTDILHKQINLQQTSADTYSVSWHADWVLGTSLNGGCLTSCIHLAAATHMITHPALVAKNQPDILSLHIEFLYPCELADSIITVTPLKIGSTACTLQLQMKQGDRLCIIALATTTNFDRSLGPSAPSDWSFYPPPCTKPDLKLIEEGKPEPNWVTVIPDSEVLTFTNRILCVGPRAGFPVAGTCDAWYRFLGDERIDATYMGLMADVIPSMSDTLMRTGLYDANVFYARAVAWDAENPGVPFRLKNTIAEAMTSKTFSMTATLSLEFRKRMPPEGMRWVFTRTATKALQDGRMGVDVTLCDEDMQIVCEAHQLILTLEAQRKFRKRKTPSSL